MCPQVAQLKDPADQVSCRRGNDHFIRARQALQSGGQIGRLTYGEFGLRIIFRRDLSYHDGSGGHADSHPQGRLYDYLFDCVHHLQGRTHAALGIVLVGTGPTEIHHEPVAPILGHMPAVSRHDLTA